MNQSSIWVDTDFGFDDLWALLLLRHLGIDVAAVSLVCGNAPLSQVVSNASSAQQLFCFNWLLYSGADTPMRQPLQTAESVLGATGMQTRGRVLPSVDASIESDAVQPVMIRWLNKGGHSSVQRHVLALGPLTNLASLYLHSPEEFNKIDRIVWMGGSAGRGNQTSQAEFNAHADPDAADMVLSAGVPIDIVDLELCRQVAFSEIQLPPFEQGVHQAMLLHDLLGGYLDIALKRGRSTMNIYDPLAAIVLAETVSIEFITVTAKVNTNSGDQRGRTEFEFAAQSHIRLATDIDSDAARTLCMAALAKNT